MDLDLGGSREQQHSTSRKKRSTRQPAYIVSTTGGVRLASPTRKVAGTNDKTVVITHLEIERIRNPTGASNTASDAKAAAEAKLAVAMAQREAKQLVGLQADARAALAAVAHRRGAIQMSLICCDILAPLYTSIPFATFTTTKQHCLVLRENVLSSAAKLLCRSQ